MINTISGRIVDFSIGTDVGCAAVTIVLLYALITENVIHKLSNKYLLAAVCCNLVALGCNLAANLLQGLQPFIPAMKLLYTLAYIALMGIALYVSLYQYSSMSGKVTVPPALTKIAVFCVAAGALTWVVCIGMDEPFFLEFTEDGFSAPGRGVVFAALPIIVLFLANITVIFTSAKHLDFLELFNWAGYMLAPLLLFFVSLAIGAFVECLVYLAATLALLIIYINTHVTRVREDNIKEKELSRSKVLLMTSQIQPHFMYNALNSIYALVDKDPELAQEAISYFSDYLRQNINSLKNDAPVSFAEELEHTKAYIYLENIRFGDKLEVLYDIQCTDFNIPPLSVQPLVENAIKHGISRREYGGVVKISAADKGSFYEVSVVDNGMGFDASKYVDQQAGNHIGIYNVNNRLREMCHASLSVSSVSGEGTICTIRLPKEFNK